MRGDMRGGEGQTTIFEAHLVANGRLMISLLGEIWFRGPLSPRKQLLQLDDGVAFDVGWW